MEEARKKLRICLIFVVMLAVLIGCIYYFGEKDESDDVNKGTLIMIEGERKV